MVMVGRTVMEARMGMVVIVINDGLKSMKGVVDNSKNSAFDIFGFTDCASPGKGAGSGHNLAGNGSGRNNCPGSSSIDGRGWGSGYGAGFSNCLGGNNEDSY